MQRHTTRWLALFLCTSALLACGDDTAAGGSSSGGNDNGGSDQGGNNTGAGNQGGDTNVGAGNQGGDNNGGAPNGGNGSGGEANGGSGQGGGVNTGADGANCVDDADCDGGFCLAENLTGIPGGMCSEDCTASETCTSATSSCVQVAATVSACLKNCDPDTAGSCGAPATLNCDVLTGAPDGGVCWGYCDMDSECSSAGKECHDEPLGNCAPPEDCDNGTDDDFDGDADCLDDECSALPECVGAGTCTGPVTLADGVVASGSTVGAMNALDSTCAVSSGNEIVFSYTSAITGGLFVSMLSASDQGIHVRTDCDDDATEVTCADVELGGDVENVQLPITAGQTVFIIVDAFEAGEEDAFQVVAQALTEECDDFFDGDADNSIDCADAPQCNGTAACTPGATAQNGTCAANTECASVAGADPSCLLPGPSFVNLPMCSEWCNIAADDCGATRQCVDVGVNEGLCFANCTINANCPAGFECVDIGTASDICLPAVPTAWTCDVEFFNDNFCDCGCGVFDPDCADATVGACEFCDDPGSCSATACPGDIDPANNATCD